jgi:quinoprotein glucose dehydrogenase
MFFHARHFHFVRLSVASFAAVAFGCISIAHAADVGQPKKPLEPKIAEASSEAVTQIGTFKVPSEWTCEVFAAEPDVANPVVLTVDNRGRVFVCESFRQEQGVTDNRKHDNAWLMADLKAMTVADRIAYHKELLGDKAASYEEQDDRIRLLIDEDGDGKADRSNVFASGFNRLEEGTGAGVLVRGNDVYYTNIPTLWLLKDSTGSGVSDERVVLADGFGVRVAFRGHDMHGLVMGPDGRIYFSIGDRGYHVQTPNGLLANPESGAVFRCELDGSNLEIFATGLRNPQELAFDDFGNLFTGDNNSDSGDKARWVYVVHGSDAGWRMMYQYISDRGPFNREKIWYPYDSKTTAAYIVPPIANFADGPSGLAYYPGTGLNDSFKGNFFLVDFRGGASNSGIRTIKNKPKGAFFEIAASEQPIWNMLATDIDFGPDGSMYVTDWVNGWNGEGKGRVYRFIDSVGLKNPTTIETKNLLNKGFQDLNEEKLVSLLGHVDRRVRAESQWELASRKALSALERVAADSSQSELARVHAVWGLGQLARNKQSAKAAVQAILKLKPSISNTSAAQSAILPAEVAVAALKVLGESHRMVEQGVLSGELPTMNEWVQDSLLGTDMRVLAAGAIAAGQLHTPGIMDAIRQALKTNANDDPIVRHACIMALAGQGDPKSISALSNDTSEAVRLAAVVAMRRMEASEITQFLKDPSERVALEAARAINDVVALHSGLPELAKSLARNTSDPAFVSRALNANFRLGNPENADAVAVFAADSTRSKAMRLEALDMLQNWSAPKPLDRVMNRYSPLPSRDVVMVSTAFAKIVEGLLKQEDLDSSVRAKTLEVGSSLNNKSIIPALMLLLTDKNAPGKDRSSAIRWLMKLDSDKGASMLADLSTDASPEVRVEAIKQLVAVAPEQSIVALSKQTLSKVMFERQSAWDTLATIESPTATKVIRDGVDRWLAGNLPLDTLLNLREAAEGRVDADLMEQLTSKLESYRPIVGDKAPKDKDVEFESSSTVTKQYLDSMVGGNVANGKDLFLNRSQLSCVRCHRVADKGGEVGPVLSGIGLSKNKEYLLEAIVDPNATIAQGFETMIVQTDSGQVVSGIAKAQDDDKLTLVTATNEVIVIEQDSIEGVKKGQSSMPVDLMKYMSRRELRDLIAYLTSLKSKNADAGGATGHGVE